MGMKPLARPGLLILLGAAVLMTQAWAGQSAQVPGSKSKVELPAAVSQAVTANFPKAEIGSVEVEKEAGINLFDIGLKADQGAIEVAEDGTVMDVAVIVAVKDAPKLVADAIQKAAPEATIRELWRSEIRAELKKEGNKGRIVKLAALKYIYKAKLVKAERKGKVWVSPDGTIVKALRWKTKHAPGQEEPQAPKAPDLKILPPAVLAAFQTAYPKAKITGTSMENEGGVTCYEVESVDGSLPRDVLYAPDGKTLEVEEALAPDALPDVVKQFVAKTYPNGKILKAETVTKGGQRYFELRIKDKDKQFSLTVDPAGKIIHGPEGGANAEK